MQQGHSFQTHGRCIRPVSYQYRFCPRCHREWPPKHRSCPECAHWLGAQPLQRTEWQVAPTRVDTTTAENYEQISASALVVRVVHEHALTDKQSVAIADIVGEVIAASDGAICEIADQGWLVWTLEGARRAFQQGREIEQRLTASIPRLQKILLHCGKIRWGVWIDQYLVPLDHQKGPAIVEPAARAIFNFEPDNVVLSSEAVYRINRRWEFFIGAPRRLLHSQDESIGFRAIGSKRPSASDHAEAGISTPFLGRERELSIIEEHWNRATQVTKLSMTAQAGSGKTRLIREWLKGHPEVHALAANFSLFGGGIENFAGQLAKLPPDRLDCSALVDAVVGHIRKEKIELLALDDLHWAEQDGLEFINALLSRLPPARMFIILAARPSGWEQLRALKPTIELKLNPLSPSAVKMIARGLTTFEPVAAIAALRSKGNPLFVEQFTAWAAEGNFHGGQSGPHTLHQTIAARIERLSKVRIADIRQRLRWGRSWERQAIDAELGQVETEVGLWLDRLETGGYTDRVEAARDLSQLERLDYEIFLTSMLVGRPRSRSSRLREAIERLLIGSANQILASLKRRAAKATAATKMNISREAKQAADVLFAAFNWSLAREFYELAYTSAHWDRDEIGRQLAQCWRHSQDTIRDDSEVYSACRGPSLNERPSVDALDRPYVWADLGRRFHCSSYFVRATKAAEAINDHALAVWAKRKAAELRANREVPSEN